MSWFRQARLWLGNSAVKEKISVETTLRHLLTSLLAIAWFVETRHPSTGGHLWCISRYARLLAEHARFSETTAAHVGATPTGHQGSTNDPESDLDNELIQRTLIASVDAMPAMALLATSSTYQASH